VTHEALIADDAFRNAFRNIARKALPYMDTDAYHTDLLHDAENATRLAVDGRFYILVRSLGTNIYAYGDDAIAQIPTTDGQAVLRVVRGAYDSFWVSEVYNLVDGHTS
jgi:hypothetical protein